MKGEETSGRSLEEILVERGSLARKKIRAAQARQLEDGGDLGRILLEMGDVSEGDLVEAQSLRLGVPAVSLADASLDLHRATDAFPLKFMQQYRFFPLRLESGVLTVVMSDPTDVDTLDAIRLQSGCEVRACLGAEREILEALAAREGVAFKAISNYTSTSQGFSFCTATHVQSVQPAGVIWPNLSQAGSGTSSAAATRSKRRSLRAACRSCIARSIPTCGAPSPSN